MIDWTKKIEAAEQAVIRKARTTELRLRLTVMRAELEYIDDQRSALFEQHLECIAKMNNYSDELYELENGDY